MRLVHQSHISISAQQPPLTFCVSFQLLVLTFTFHRDRLFIKDAIIFKIGIFNMFFFKDGVRDTTYYPQRRIYEIGENITCTAKGNPSPTFEWESDKGNYIGPHVF